MSRLTTASVWVRIGACLAVPVALALAACGISADERVTHIPAADLGDVAATNTTTTTTTTVPPTVPATSSPPSLPDTTTTSTSTTTTEALQTWPVTVFYIPRGDDSTVKRVTVQQSEPNVNDLLRLLSNPSPRVFELGLGTAVSADLVTSIDIQRLHTVIDLDPAAFERMGEASKRQAIAQLVLTFTSFVTPDHGAIGAVAFSVGGEPISVIIPGQGQSDPGEPVVFVDFEPWIDSPDDTRPTTAPPTAPPSTAPPIPETSAPSTVTPA